MYKKNYAVYPPQVKPLSNHMLELLMDGPERELMNLEPYDAGTLKHAKGLLGRRMLSTKTYLSERSKRFIGIYVTHSGKKYLSTIK